MAPSRFSHSRSSGKLEENQHWDVTAAEPHTRKYSRFAFYSWNSFLRFFIFPLDRRDSLHNSHQQWKLMWNVSMRTFELVYVKHSFIIIILLLFHLRLVNVWMEICLRFAVAPFAVFDDEKKIVWSSKIPIARSLLIFPWAIRRLSGSALCGM